MSTYYDFFAEAKINGKWHNIDFHTIGIDGKLLHHFLYSISRSFLGRLSDLVHNANHLKFEDLAEGTQKILLDATKPQYEDSVALDNYFCIGTIPDLERLVDAPYEYEFYITRNQMAALEAHQIDDIDDGLSAKELLELPEEARREYVLYRWDYPTNSRNTVQYLVRKLKEQLEQFNESIPYQSGIPYSDQKASEVRVLYRIS